MITGRNLRVRLLASFLYRAVNTMTVPFMAIYLAHALGPVAAGLLMMAVAVTAAAAAVVGGPLCDLAGRRPMLLMGEFGTGLAFAAAAAATARHLAAPIAFACFICATTLYALVLPAHDASIVDVTSPASRKAYYSVNYWCVNVAIGVGSILGSFLYRSYFPAVLLGAGLTLLALGAVTASLFAETLSAPARAAAWERGLGLGGLARSYRIVLADRGYAALILAATLAISIELQLTSYLTVRLAREVPEQRLLPMLPGLGRVSGLQLVGVMRTENTLLVVVLAVALAPVLRAIADRARLLGGLAVFTGGFMVLAVSSTAWILLAAMFVLTVGEILNVPVKQALIANSVRHEARGSYVSAYQLTGNLGWVIATACISLGSAVGGWGMAALYAVCGTAAAAIFGSRLRRQDSAGPAGLPDVTPAEQASG